jgi:D-xylose transport system substrate-binding protein
MVLFRRFFLAAAAAAAITTAAGAARAQQPIVGVSWRHFQEERWKIDEAALKSVLDKAGITYVSAARRAPRDMATRGGVAAA